MTDADPVTILIGMDKRSQQSNLKDKRRYLRVPSGTRIRWCSVDVSEEARNYLVGLAENYSFGGVFLVTDEPLERGSFVEIGFSVPVGPPVSALAVVRWVRRFRKLSGLGLQFIEFDGIGDRDFNELIDSIFRS